MRVDFELVDVIPKLAALGPLPRANLTRFQAIFATEGTLRAADARRVRPAACDLCRVS
jgi:hypothetical protein